MGIIELLNGKVPGGITLLFILLTAFTFIMLYLLKNSPLLTKRNFLKILISGCLAMIIIYALIWRINPPIIPKTRVMIGPFKSIDKNEGLAFSEHLSSLFSQNLNKEVYVMNWEWIFNSVAENVDEYKYMEKMLNSKKPDIWIIGALDGNSEKSNLKLKIIIDGEDNDPLTFSSPWDNCKEIAKVIKEKTGLNFNFPPHDPNIDLLKNTIKWERNFRQKKYDVIVKEVEESGELSGNNIKLLTLYSRAMSQLAFKKKKAFGEKSILDTQLKEYELMFNKARKPLIPFAREESPNINVLLALAKSYLLESKFGYADAVLKQCVTQEVNNYKVFYLLSFLHFTRLPEIGFKNAFEVLERAYVLNPYDEKTVLRYADFMFNLRAPSSDLLYHAIAMVKEYQKLNPRSINVYMKLGYFYLYLNEIENAEKTYNMADSLFPGDKNIILNRGIIAQRKKEFSKAIDIFNSIIDENEYKDVYTYLGSVYLEKEEPEKALEYFRKRVRISRNEDDPMYREALKGIRKSLQVQEDMNEK